MRKPSKNAYGADIYPITKQCQYLVENGVNFSCLFCEQNTSNHFSVLVEPYSESQVWVESLVPKLAEEIQPEKKFELYDGPHLIATGVVLDKRKEDAIQS